MTERRAKRILLCAAGGYQVYSLPGFILSLLKNFADEVQVVLSPAAAKMTSIYSIEVATRRPVYVEMDDKGPDVYVPHIELARDVDLILVYPATVSIMGKIANGIADELIAAIVVAAEVPVFFVPIANPAMLAHPAVERNIEQLRQDGYVVLPSPPSVEIATREGLMDAGSHFPLPTLLMRMASALTDRAVGVARRGPAKI
jgi:phosphopantothenoylcysteine decarboxylase/phosphopantothenate--cysteine ligase